MTRNIVGTTEFKRLHENAKLPYSATIGAAGKDLYAVEDVVAQPGDRVLVPLGFAMALPEGLEFQIRPRSGNAFKYGLTVLNSPGTIDSDYRGEVKVILHNTSDTAHLVKAGDKVAQGVYNFVPLVDQKWVDELDDTERGEGGFGHTGS